MKYSKENPRGLTPQMVRIVQLLADGQSQKEVAIRLSICPGTVKNTVLEARKITQARSTYHLVAKAIREGLIL